MKSFIFILFASIMSLSNAQAREFGQYFVICNSKIDQENEIYFNLNLEQNGATTVSNFQFIASGQVSEAQQVKIKFNVGSRDPNSILPLSYLRLAADENDVVFASNDGQNYFLNLNYNSSNPQSYTCRIGMERPG